MTGLELEKRICLLFDQGRELVRHEDDLVDRRLKWVITIVAFIFAAYGATWIAMPNDLGSEDIPAVVSLGVVRIPLVLLGIFVSILGSTSILAAHLSVSAINRKYRQFIQKHEEQIEEFGIQVWKIIGDGSGEMPGFYSSSLIPFTISITCAAIAGFEFVLIFYLSSYVLGAWPIFLLYIAFVFGLFCAAVAIDRIVRRASKHLKLVKISSERSFGQTAYPDLHPKGSLSRISSDSFRRQMKSLVPNRLEDPMQSKDGQNDF